MESLQVILRIKNNNMATGYSAELLLLKSIYFPNRKIKNYCAVFSSHQP